MKVLLALTIICISVLKINGDLIEQGCQFIRQHEDLLPSLLECETQAYPARFTEISNICLNETIGMTKIQHIKAMCRNEVDIFVSMKKLQSCVTGYQSELMGMVYDIINGLMKAQRCMSRIISNHMEVRRYRRDTIYSEAADAVEGFLHLSGPVTL